MRSRLLYTIIFSAVLFQSVLAQKFNPYYNFKQLNEENGLAQNIVYHFLQDSRGYMWVGTRNGISLFDGVRTVNLLHDDQNKKSISGNFITRILEDADHTIWVGTNAGIDFYDIKENSFHHFSIEKPDGQYQDTYCVLLGFINKYELWFIETESKTIKIFNTKTKKFKQVCSTDAVDGTIYYNSHSNTVDVWSYLSMSTTHMVFRNDSLLSKEEFFGDEKNKGKASLLIFHVFVQNDSVTWLSTAKGLIKLNVSAHTHEVYDTADGRSIKEVRAATLSPNGQLWVSSTSGLFIFDIQAKKFLDNFSNDVLDPFSICSNNIVSLYFDHSGNIWCGSYGDGVSYANVQNNYFSKSLSKSEMKTEKKQNEVLKISADQEGNFWCLVQNVQEFWQLDSSLHIKTYRRPLLDNGKIFNGSVYQLLFNGKYTAWCGTDRGLFLFNTISNKMRQVHYPTFSNELFGSNWINMMIRLHDSSILLSTMSGLYRISEETGKESIKPFSNINQKPFKSFDLMYEDSEKNIYVKDIGQHLYVLQDSGQTGNYLIKKDFVFPSHVAHFSEDENDIYIASATGLYLLHKKNFAIEKSSINNLLPFNGITNVLVQKNKLWLFGEKGLYCLDRMQNTGRLFTTEDGLPANKFDELAMIVTNSGKCLSGTSNGLVSFYPNTLNDTIYPPRPQLINMYVNDSSKGFLANPQHTSAIILSHDQNTFSFDFSCISFQHADACTYSYKLANYDENWIAGGNTHYTRYSRIPPGKYTFMLRVSDASGKRSPYIKTMEINIEKAFWQTTIFKIISAIILAAIVLLCIKWYLRTRIQKQQRAFEKQQAIEKERTRIATDMHDDLGAGLSRIKFLSETIGIKKQMRQPVEEDISSISGYANEMIGKMGEIIWALNEKNDSLSDLLSYTRSYAVDYLMTNGIECQVNAPSTFPSIFLSGEFRRNIYLTIKEALHNILKHARANKVVIEIAIGKKLEVSIQDDGVGFDINNKRPFSNGINNMQKRMEDIGGSLTIIQKKGTTVILSAPLPE
ncbi:MAG: hypothetical protein JST75_08500 [Bacteroidetes bacterium]|nr:hypothetical protein [Bacteroidota bacterium]